MYLVCASIEACTAPLAAPGVFVPDAGKRQLRHAKHLTTLFVSQTALNLTYWKACVKKILVRRG